MSQARATFRSDVFSTSNCSARFLSIFSSLANQQYKRVFGLVIDFGTSQSPKSTRPLTTYSCPSRPGHQALRNNFASSLLLRTCLPMTGRRVWRPTLFSLWRKARRENSAASRLLGTTSLRFALHGWQRMYGITVPFKREPAVCLKRIPNRLCGTAEMTITRLKAAAWYYPQSVLATLGLFWLVIEPIIGLTGESIHLTLCSMLSGLR